MTVPPLALLAPPLLAAHCTGARPSAKAPSPKAALQLVTCLFLGWGAAEWGVPGLWAGAMASLGWVAAGWRTRLSSPLLPAAILMGLAITQAGEPLRIGSLPLPFPLVAMGGALACAAWASAGASSDPGASALRAFLSSLFLLGIPHLGGNPPEGIHLIPALPAAAAAWVWAVRGGGKGLWWALLLAGGALAGGQIDPPLFLSAMAEGGVVIWSTLASLLLWGFMQLLSASPWRREGGGSRA